jgi:cytochrome c-type biogenesis protein CcmH/NrfF
LAILAAVALGEPRQSADPAKEAIVQRLKEALQCPCCTRHLNNGGAALDMATIFGIFGSELEGYVTDQIQRMIGD